MHELSIANAILGEVTDAMKANGVDAVTDVTVEVGRLSGVVAGALEFGWSIVRQGTPLAETELLIVDDPVRVWCPDGDHQVTLGDMVFQCPEHGCPTPEILSGESLRILRFSVGDDSQATAHTAAAHAAGDRTEREPVR